MIPALIMVTTIATSSTGGNYAGPGSVVETGAQSAQSYVQTQVSASGTTTVDIRTESNGVSTSTREEIGSSSVPVRIEVRASAHSAAPAARIVPRPSVHATSSAVTVSATSTASSSTSVSTSSVSALVVPRPAAMVPPSIAVQIVHAIVSFFRSLFGL